MSAPSARPRVLLCFNRNARENYATAPDLERLEAIANWDWLPSEGAPAQPGVWGAPSGDPADAERLRARVGDVDALVVADGAPMIDASIFDVAPCLRLVGDLGGDRFSNRIDAEAAHDRGVRIVDTTNGSSPPVAEWALGLILVGLKNASAHYRRMIAGEYYKAWRTTDDPAWRMSELTGRTVGIIGLGHIGRRLVELLHPFRCRIVAHDPYVAKEVAIAVHVQLTSLDHVMDCEVVACCAPLTPRTRRMIGARELDLLRPESVFVNVSRGAIVDPDALIARARRGDSRFGLDVFDPDPPDGDSEIRRLPNVFLTPHLAGYSAACNPRFFALMVDELERYILGHETLFDITPRVLANRRGLPPARS